MKYIIKTINGVFASPGFTKIFFIALILLVLVSTVLTIVVINQGNNKPENIEPVVTTLTFWGRTVDEDVMNPIISEFESQNPLIKIDYKQQTETEYKERIDSRMESGNTAQLPDIVEIDEYWLDEYGVTNLDQVTSNNILSKFPSQLIENQSLFNIAYGIPFNFNSLALAYNRPHLNAINVTASDLDGMGWSEALQLAKDLTITQSIEQENQNEPFIQINKAGIAVGSSSNVMHAEKLLNMLLLQNGVEIYDTIQKEFVLDDDGIKDVLSFYLNFAGSNVWNNSMEQDVDTFLKDKLSMVFVDAEGLKKVEDGNISFVYDVATPFKISEKLNVSFSTSLVIPKLRAFNSTKAQIFIEYLNKPENLIQIHQENTSNIFIPSTPEALTEIPQNSLFSIYADIAPVAVKLDYPKYDQVKEVLDEYLEDIYDRAYDASTGTTNVDRASLLRTSPLEKDLNEAIEEDKPVF